MTLTQMLARFASLFVLILFLWNVWLSREVVSLVKSVKDLAVAQQRMNEAVLSFMGSNFNGRKALEKMK